MFVTVTAMNTAIPELEHNAVLLKLMGNPERLAVLALLQGSERSIDELAGALALPPTVVSKHLARLRAGKLVDYTRYHRVLQYRLVSKQVSAVLDALLAPDAGPQKSAVGDAKG